MIETRATLGRKLNTFNKSIIDTKSQGPKRRCLTEPLSLEIKPFTSIFPLLQHLDSLLQSMVEPALIPASSWDRGMSVTVLSFPRLSSCMIFTHFHQHSLNTFESAFIWVSFVQFMSIVEMYIDYIALSLRTWVLPWIPPTWIMFWIAWLSMSVWSVSEKCFYLLKWHSNRRDPDWETLHTTSHIFELRRSL